MIIPHITEMITIIPLLPDMRIHIDQLIVENLLHREENQSLIIIKQIQGIIRIVIQKMTDANRYISHQILIMHGQ